MFVLGQIWWDRINKLNHQTTWVRIYFSKLLMSKTNVFESQVLVHKNILSRWFDSCLGSERKWSRYENRIFSSSCSWKNDKMNFQIFFFDLQNKVIMTPLVIHLFVFAIHLIPGSISSALPDPKPLPGHMVIPYYIRQKDEQVIIIILFLCLNDELN